MRSRHDELRILLGSLVSGLSALTFITASSHSLGLNQFRQILQIWTIWALSAGGLGFSVQQHVITSAGAYRSVFHALRSQETLRVTVPLMSGVAVVTTIWRTEIFGDSSVIWPLFATLIPLGCAATSTTRGLWAARRKFRFVAFLSALENIVRAAAALVLWIFDAGPGSFALAILLGFGVALLAPRSSLGVEKATQPRTQMHGAAIAGLLAYATLVMSPTIMAVKSVNIIETSSTFILLALLRTPYQLSLSLVPKFTADRKLGKTRTRSNDHISQSVLQSVRRKWTLLFYVISGIVAVTLGTPVAVQILFGNLVAVSVVQSLLATTATAIAVVNIVLVVAASAARLDRQLITIWVSAAGLGVAYIAMAPVVSLTSMLCTVVTVELGVATGLLFVLHRHNVPLYVGVSCPTPDPGKWTIAD